jgi:hypothetical protein
MISIDYAFDPESGYKIKNGDFVREASDDKHIKDILTAKKGDWRQWPLIGVNIYKWLKAAGDLISRNALVKEIKLQLEYDNYKDVQVKGNSAEEFTINATRKK